MTLESSAGAHAGLRRPAAIVVSNRAQIVGVGTATPKTAYSQKEVLDAFNIEDRRVRLMFMNSAIGRRHLTLPPEGEDGVRANETQGELLEKHSKYAVEIGAAALRKAVERAGATLDDVRYLCCVTTTGLLTPGLSALLCKELGLRRDCSRTDIVGMGCHAGLNGMNTVVSWAQANPGKLAVMVCAEICSAAYVFDGTMQTAVVNSLFADGAAALAVMSAPANGALPATVTAAAAAGDSGALPPPTVLAFNSRVVPEAIDAMKFAWDEQHGKFNFFLAQDVPYVVGANAEDIIDQLLRGAGLRRSDIAHWIVHSGGKKVIDSVKVNLGLSAHDVRHTISVLHDYGNMSSGSFLFSYERLLDEGAVQPGDYGVMMTMGPGTTIETALLRW
ncbi:type III polyketide synthase [Duganella ginsengisoli]|uniref:Type III polyketide synthase n=2 Tax=Pseudoduganella ginsengisoli TaxID=1462440 RepID=A0A6L6Q7C6_9BURK|nr:type III polyketide synthase [Pseudoduganella ginsengisoli]